MKKTILSLCLVCGIGAVISGFSPTKTNSGTVPSKETTATLRETVQRKKFYIYYADWDRWGRTSRQCAGWGLCYFTDCWFCCVDDKGNVVSCKDNVKVTMAGKAVIDGDTNEGVMYINMEPSDEAQNAAIMNKSTFYVDEDLPGAFFTVHAGEYEFDPTVGEYGGYKLIVTGK